MVGYLLSDRMAIGKWALLFGSIRYDHIITQYADAIQTNMSGDKNNIETSYSVGGNFKLNGDKLALFGNVSTSFQPSTTVDLGTGQLQDDVHAIGYEAGFKGEMLDGKAYWTLSAYRIDRKDVPQANPHNPDGTTFGVAQYIGTGWERNNGIELEVYADINPEWSLMLAGSYMHAFTVVPAPGDEARAGVPLLREPRRSGSATVTRTFKSGPLSHLKIGASVRYTDSYVAQFGTAGSQVTGADATAANNYGITRNLVLNYGPTNRIEEVRPAAQVYDMFVSYWFNMGRYRHSINFSIKNLFDKVWYSAGGRLNDGRTYYVSYTLKY
jgi:outer membrane receptor protein involved in Fe transport